MTKLLSLTLPGGNEINSVPTEIPQGGIGELNNIFSWAYQLILVGAVIIVLFFLVRAGMLWISSGGDKQKLSKARSTIVYSILGLAIIFLAFFIIRLIEFLFQGK